MMLSELTPIPEEVLPKEAFKAHLRLGTGFDESGLQDEVLLGYLRAAITAIEARTAKVILARDFALLVSRWQTPAVDVLPLAPVQTVAILTAIDSQGAETEIPASHYRLEPDSHQPRLCATGPALPAIPRNGQVRITLRAGLAGSWAAVPGDLAQAVLMLAAHYYEYRDDLRLQGGCMPFGVSSLIERYRPLRVTLGARPTLTGGQ